MRPLPEPEETRGLDAGWDSLGATYQLLHSCGYKVRCGIMRYGDGLGGLVFFDDKEASITRGERVSHCPGCHDRLGFVGLRSRGLRAERTTRPMTRR